jgi:DNA-binding transcriptional MerR regulator
MQNNSENKEDLITVSEVARELEVSEQTIRNYESRGTLKAFRLNNGTRVFRREDAQGLKFIKSRKAHKR